MRLAEGCNGCGGGTIIAIDDGAERTSRGRGFGGSAAAADDDDDDKATSSGINGASSREHVIPIGGVRLLWRWLKGSLASRSAMKRTQKCSTQETKAVGPDPRRAIGAQNWVRQRHMNYDWLPDTLISSFCKFSAKKTMATMQKYQQHFNNIQKSRTKFFSLVRPLVQPYWSVPSETTYGVQTIGVVANNRLFRRRGKDMEKSAKRTMTMVLDVETPPRLESGWCSFAMRIELFSKSGHNALL
jgi:hypothetical protein